MEGGQYPILTFDSTYDLGAMMQFLGHQEDLSVLTSEQRGFVQWLDEVAFSSPQPGLKMEPVENMEVDQIEDQNGEKNLYDLLQNVAFFPEANEEGSLDSSGSAETEGQKSMGLYQDNCDDQDVLTPEDMPPPIADIEVQENPPEEGTSTAEAVAVEQTKRKRKRKVVVVNEQRQQPKRECKERQSRKAAFEQENARAKLYQRRNRSEISKEEHEQARKATSKRR